MSSSYERTKAYRHRYPHLRKIERDKHYTKHRYGKVHERIRYTMDEIELVLTKKLGGVIVVDRTIAKMLHRSLRAIQVYRSHLLSKRDNDKVAGKWRAFARKLQKEGRIWRKP